MPASRRAVITGLGVISPIGSDPAAVWAEVETILAFLRESGERGVTVPRERI